MDIPVLFTVGAVTGIFGSLFGIGGGIFAIPVFLYMFNFDPQYAVGSATCVVLFNSVSGTAGYYRAGKIFFAAAWKLGIATIPGAFLGSYATNYLSGPLFSLIFGCFLFAMAVFMHRKSNNMPAGSQTSAPQKYNLFWGIICSFGIGFLSSFLGIGGGLIYVPFMIYILKFPIHIAVATSTCILCISAFWGMLSHALLGHILWLPAVCVGAGAVIGAQIGVKLSLKLQAVSLAKYTAYIIFLMGIKFICSYIG